MHSIIFLNMNNTYLKKKKKKHEQHIPTQIKILFNL